MKLTPSPNFGPRKDVTEPRLLIVHYTGMQNAQAALAQLCDPAAEVSAHYLIDEGGEIVQLVPEEHRAWHAGRSHWRGHADINSLSVGIELVNPGHEFGYNPFPQAQIAALVRLAQNIIARWGMEAGAVLGHSDVAPGRKVDPGHLFPWKALADQGVGLWPQTAPTDHEAGADLLAAPGALHEVLLAIGYDPSASRGDVMTEFMRHFHPERFSHWQDRPAPDKETAARALALLRALNAQTCQKALFQA